MKGSDHSEAQFAHHCGQLLVADFLAELLEVFHEVFALGAKRDGVLV
jgi:hypothetical protein